MTASERSQVAESFSVISCLSACERSGHGHGAGTDNFFNRRFGGDPFCC